VRKADQPQRRAAFDRRADPKNAGLSEYWSVMVKFRAAVRNTSSALNLYSTLTTSYSQF